MKAHIGSLGNQSPFQHVLRDHLGSVDTLIDGKTGAVLQHRGYDVFGRPRNIAAGNGLLTSWQGVTKGYTDHEHLNEQQLIHMNGRIYDYNVGRFLSVDPFLQFPENSQSANPYSYILNNPMSGTDPTGYKSEGECETKAGGTEAFCSVVQISDSEKKKKKKKETTVPVSNGEKNEEIDWGKKAIETYAKITGANKSTSGRSVSRTDSDGSVHSWTVNDNIDPNTPEGAWALIQGKQNEGQGYQDWANAGGDRSAANHPLVLMGMTFAPTSWLGKAGNWAKGLFGIRTGVNATVATEKFSAYIFKEGATHGKDAIYRGLGYTAEHSAQLAKTYQSQAAKLFSQGKYTAGDMTQYGQRISIGINLRGVGTASGKSAHIKSGWMIRNDGSISLSTPFSGFMR